MRLNVDFTTGDGATFSNWIGSQTLSASIDESQIRQVNTKENPVQLAESINKNPTWTENSVNRDLQGYNIYRDGTFLDNSGYNTEYYDFNVDSEELIHIMLQHFTERMKVILQIQLMLNL